MERFLKRKLPPGFDIDGNGGESSTGDTSENNAQASSIFSSTNPSIQKDLANCFKQEVKIITDEIGSDVFSLLIDESSDEKGKKQMVVVLRYVDACGIVKERIFGRVNVMETSALSLKSSIDSLFAEHGLSWKKVRGQSYNGASDMRDEFNGLKDLIIEENSSAYYVHCFAHQLELIVVAVAKAHFGVGHFFDMTAILNNLVCVSCKRKDTTRENQKEKVQKAIGENEIKNGLNQESSTIRGGDINIGFHYNTLKHSLRMFPSIVEVLEYIEEEGDTYLSRRQAHGLQVYFKSFDFVFYLHLMFRILGITHILPRALQGKGKNVLNAMSVARATKIVLQQFKDDGFDSLLKEICTFCEKHDIDKLNMAEDYVNPKKPRQKTNITNRQYYELDCFNIIVNMQIKEFNDRFSDVTSELLICTTALNPCDSFRHFDLSKLLRLAKMYPNDFSCVQMMSLENQLDFYTDIKLVDKRFANLNGIVDLARVMVETRKHRLLPMVYRLLKLALVLPVETATTER